MLSGTEIPGVGDASRRSPGTPRTDGPGGGASLVRLQRALEELCASAMREAPLSVANPALGPLLAAIDQELARYEDALEVALWDLGRGRYAAVMRSHVLRSCANLRARAAELAAHTRAASCCARADSAIRAEALVMRVALQCLAADAGRALQMSVPRG